MTMATAMATTTTTSKVAGPPEMEFSLNVGVQFGLTDVTSDTALKFQGSLALLGAESSYTS